MEKAPGVMLSRPIRNTPSWRELSGVRKLWYPSVPFSLLPGVQSQAGTLHRTNHTAQAHLLENQERREGSFFVPGGTENDPCPTAEVLRANRPMQAVFNKSECKVSTRLEGNVYSYRLDFVWA